MTGSLAALRERADAAQRTITAWLHGDGTGARLVELLVAERGWTADHAGLAVAAYERFLVLEAVGHGPYPSITVDAVRQTHLTLPGYGWFYDQVMGKPPSGLLVEDGFRALVKRWRAYQTTCEAHALLFGTPDPIIWTPVESRFTAPADFTDWEPEPWHVGHTLVRMMICVLVGLAIAVGVHGILGIALAIICVVWGVGDVLTHTSFQRNCCPRCPDGQMTALHVEVLTPDMSLHGWRCSSCSLEGVRVERTLMTQTGGAGH